MNIPSNIRTWAEIDRSAIRENLRATREMIGPQAGVLAVVKANGYGHGLREVAGAIADLTEIFGVANVEEALEIADLGRDCLLLSPSLPGEREEVVRGNFIATVSSAAEAREFAGGRVHLKVDTGMGRVGCAWEKAEEELREIVKIPNVRLHSVSSHLPVADEDEEFTRDQLELFGNLAERFRQVAPAAKIHVLNSAGILRFSNHSYDLVRPGLVLYGVSPLPDFQPQYRPALAWKSRLSLVRDLEAHRTISYGRTYATRRETRLALLALGYADGLPRQSSGREAQVLVDGRRCPVLGRVTMDQIVVDVTDVPDAREGDEAVMIGRQGDEEITASEWAAWAQTIPWDIFTGLHGRVKRFYGTLEE